MNAKLERALCSPILTVTSLVLPLLAPAFATAASAQSLPPFERFPSDAPGRLARAVAERVADLSSTMSPQLADLAPDQLDRPQQRHSLWDSIQGALGTQSPLAALAAGARPVGPASLVDVLDGAIGAYMTELGRIALEIDQGGERDAVSRLAPLHPGEQGTGSIAVGDVGAFHQLEINFRAEIAHPDGRAPAVIASFYLMPGSGGPPIPARLVIPTSGAQPSFRAEIATATGARETRDYGWRPRLARLGSILELDVNGRWARVEDELGLAPRRKTPHDPDGFCDATCINADR